MTPKEELKKLIASMSDEQIKRFIAQMQHVLFEESEKESELQTDGPL